MSTNRIHAGTAALLCALLTASCGENATADAGPPDAAVVRDVHVEGLRAPVRIVFDAHGVPHIQCEHELDCRWAYGYVQAHDRFLFLELQRRLGRGRLAGLVGSEGVMTDRMMRELLTTADGESFVEVYAAQLDPDVRAEYEAYAAGVNCFLAEWREGRNGARLAMESEFPLVDLDAIDDYTVEDSVAAAAVLAVNHTNHTAIELDFEAAAAGLSPDAAHDLLGPTAVTDASAARVAGEGSAPIVDARGPRERRSIRQLRLLERARPALRGARARLEALSMVTDESGLGGSNIWAVGPERSANGRALLAFDPHSALSNPAQNYLVEMDATGGESDFHVLLGSAVLGHNEHIAFGFTNAFYDLADLYVEELSPDGESVRFGDEWVPIVEREQTYEVAHGAPVTATARYVPHHGLILEEADGYAISIRLAALQSFDDFTAIEALYRATSLEDADAALRGVGAINAGAGVMDRDGSIGVLAYTLVPSRPWASPDLNPGLPLPGDGSAEWDGFVPLDALPRFVDPPTGIVASSNQPFYSDYGDGDPSNDGHAWLQSRPVQPWRLTRIAEQLAARDDHDVESFTALHGDPHSVWAELTLPSVLATAAEASLSDAARDLFARLDAWTFACPSGLTEPSVDAALDPDPQVAADSIACSIFHRLIVALVDGAFGDELDGVEALRANIWRHLVRSLVFLLNDSTRLRGGDAYWDDVETDATETRGDVIAAALDATATGLVEDLGDDPDAWRWGLIHQVTLAAPLFSDVGITDYDNGPYPQYGAAFGVQNFSPARPTDPVTGRFDFSEGSQLRMIVEGTDDGLRSHWQLAGGQRHHRDSPHYDDLLQRWLRNEPTRVAFGAEEVEEAAVEVWILRPAE